MYAQHVEKHAFSRYQLVEKPVETVENPVFPQKNSPHDNIVLHSFHRKRLWKSGGHLFFPSFSMPGCIVLHFSPPPRFPMVFHRNTEKICVQLVLCKHRLHTPAKIKGFPSICAPHVRAVSFVRTLSARTGKNQGIPLDFVHYMCMRLVCANIVCTHRQKSRDSP